MSFLYVSYKSYQKRQANNDLIGRNFDAVSSVLLVGYVFVQDLNVKTVFVFFGVYIVDRTFPENPHSCFGNVYVLQDYAWRI